MAHIAADRVKETTTTTGTGAITLAGAATGFRAFSSVMAANDTCFYCIAGGSEWEVGLGTFNTTLTRTTVIASSNAGAAVNFSAGTKDVFITSPAQVQGWGTLVTTPSTDQNDYNPTGLAFCNTLGINASASITISGLVGGVEGRSLKVQNRSSDYLLILENEHTSSSAANRLNLPNGFPLFLFPGDHVELSYNGTSSRWDVESGSINLSQMGLTTFEDFLSCGGVTLTNNWQIGAFSFNANGTGASAQNSSYLVNTTEKPVGVMQLDTGTTATGRAGFGNAGTDHIVPTTGAVLSVARIAIETTVSGTETFQVVTGFVDSLNAGTLVDGVFWNNRWTGAAAEWSQDRASNSTITRSNTGSPTPDNNYIWLAVFINPGWTRADFFYSTDSMNWTKADSPTTGLPASTRPTSFTAVNIIKSVGTTQRNVSIDLAGYRVDVTRG